MDTYNLADLGQSILKKMKLLMITRKIDKNDPQAGFAYNWVKKLGQKLENFKVICLEKGNTEGLPDNIEIFSLGKEKGKNRLKEFISFQKAAWKFIRQVDGVFCHQNIIYTVLIWPYAKIFGKKIVSFFGHKYKGPKLYLLNFLADKIVTSSVMGFRLDTPKRIIIGQGIDTDFFKPASQKIKSDIIRIISVGRISPIKNYETLIEAADIIKEKKVPFIIKVVGIPILKEQIDYSRTLINLVKEKNLAQEVKFIGGVSQSELVKLYQESDLAVNLCPTGAPDKGGLEPMACAVPLLAANQSFSRDFGSYSEKLLFKEKDAQDLANKIQTLRENKKLAELGDYLRKQIIKHHNLDNLLHGILKCF